MSTYPFNQQKSALLKAVLPFLIILHHCACKGVPHLGPMLLAGVTVCTWFFAISGFGLMTSYTVKGQTYLKGFMRKRWSRVLIPFLVAFCTYLLFETIVMRQNLIDYLSSRTFDNWLPYSWFLFVILGEYALYRVIFRFYPPPNRNSRLDEKLRNSVAFLACNIAYIILLAYLGVPRYWYGGILGIAIGMFWSLYEKPIMKILESNVISILLLVTAAALWVVFSKYIQFKEFHPFFTCTMLIVVMHKFPYRKSNGIVDFLSRISFELYLFQSLAMALIWDMAGIKIGLLSMIYVMVADIIISALFHYLIITPITNKIAL